MRKSLLLPALATSIALTALVAPPAQADDHFKDPFRGGPLVGTVDWCEWTVATEAAKVVDDVAEFITDIGWGIAEFFGVAEEPPDAPFVPELNNPDGCKRARDYDQERLRRADLLRQTGDGAVLWQNRDFPYPMKDSREDPPDFVVVGMGDSFASGEGNPAQGIDWRKELWGIDSWSNVTWSEFQESSAAMSESDDPDAASFCHRSSKSAFASAMLELRRLYPQYNVYWRNFACSGAETRHLWKDKYVTWKFFQSQREAGVSRSASDEQAFNKVAGSDATQDTQIEQAKDWLATFANKTPKVDATYMSIGGNDVYFGPVISTCVHPLAWNTCERGAEWLDLAEAAIAGGTVQPSVRETIWSCPLSLAAAGTVVGGIQTGASAYAACLLAVKRMNDPSRFGAVRIAGNEVIDPLGGTQCTTAEIARVGCLSHFPATTSDRWSSSVARYQRLNTEIRSNLSPGRIYLAEVPDFTRSDDARSYCGDSWPESQSASIPGSAWPWADEPEFGRIHDPYARMNEDWLLSNSEPEAWQYASTKVGQPLVEAIRRVATDNGRDTGTNTSWYLVSKGPTGDTLFEGWRKKHGMCALQSYVHTFEEAQDNQGEDYDGVLDASAGSMHPNAFGQQDYAERILLQMEKQLIEKMTPKLSLRTPVMRPLPVVGMTTLGGSGARTLQLDYSWADFEYPNGNDRVTVDIRTTPIVADIKRVNLASLGLPGNFTYRVEVPQKSTVESYPGDSTLPSGAFGVTLDLAPEAVGVLVEVRACGPTAFDGDYRTCSKWQTPSSAVRTPLDIYDPLAYGALRKIEKRLSPASFAAQLKTVLTKLTSAKVMAIIQSGKTMKVPFGFGNILGLTADSVRDNARPLPNLSKGVEPDWTAQEPALRYSASPEDLVACGIPDYMAEGMLDRLERTKYGGLAKLGADLVRCLETGEPTIEWPQLPVGGAELLENTCSASEEDLEQALTLIRSEGFYGPDFDEAPEAMALLQCLQDQGVPLMSMSDALEQELNACSLDVLDFPLLNYHFSPPIATQDAVNCLRDRSGLPPLYWFLSRGSP